MVDYRIDELGINNYKIIQKKSGFCFGIDAVLLANFVDAYKNESVLDLGTGTGIIPILLTAKKSPGKITGIEIFEEMVQMAKASVKLNNLEDRIEIRSMDIKEAKNKLNNKLFDIVVSNPPYTKYGGGITNESEYKKIARHEILCTLEDLISSASKLTKQYGRFYMVHRPNRLVDIISLMRAYKLEPKLMRFVYPKAGKKPNLVLIMGIKSSRPQMEILPSLYVYNKDGAYTKEIIEIYGGQYLE